jgi:alanine racemase
VARSELTVDLGAIRRNVRTLVRALEGAELWAVVKADGYGHGAVDVAGAALGTGATAACVATVPEGLALRRELGTARILVLGPFSSREIAEARDAGLELAIADGEVPEGVRCHLKLDTGMGRWGLSELPVPGRDVVGLMSHLASADCDAAFTEQQVERFRAATDAFAHLTRHLANSAGALRYPSARFDAARCGIALYGISPFGTDPAEDGLEPALRWDSELAQVRQLQPGESTGYASWPWSRRGSGSCPSAMRTGSAATSPGRRCASPGSRVRSWARSRWTPSPSSSTASFRSARR